MRQAERNQRAVVTQGSSARVTQTVLGLTDASLSELRYRAMTGADDLSGPEVLRLINLVLVWADMAMEAWIQRRDGLIDDLMYEHAIRPTRTIFTSPAYRAMWSMTRANFPREFGEVFQKEIERFPLRPTVDFAHQFKLSRAALETSGVNSN